jgi:hypothetical protein
MTVVQPSGGGATALDRPSSSGLADVIDVILDKGLVIDAYVRVSLVGIEVLTIDARVVVASVDTYLKFAEAVNRLDLSKTEEQGLPELMSDLNQGTAKNRSKGAAQGALEAASEKLQDVIEGVATEADSRGSRRKER